MSSRRGFLQCSSLALATATAGCTLPRLRSGSGSGPDEEAGIIWDRRYEGERGNRLFVGAIPAATGGFLLVGSTAPDIDTLGQGVAIRTDEAGREQWRYTVSEVTDLGAATQGANGEFVISTYVDQGGGTGDSGAIALREDGTERWRTTLSESGESYLRSVVQVSDGSYVLGGADRDAGWLVRLESDGSVRTNRRLVLETRRLTGVATLHPSGSGVTVMAHTGRGGTPSAGSALFKLAPDDSMEWGRRYGERFWHSTATDDGYVLFRPEEDLLGPQLTRVDVEGSVTGSRAYAPPGYAHRFVAGSVIRTANGGFIVGGSYEPWEDQGMRRGPMVMQTSSGGESVAWTRLYEQGTHASLVRAGTNGVFSDTIREGRQARLVRFEQPQSSNVELEPTTVSGPRSEPL